MAGVRSKPRGPAPVGRLDLLLGRDTTTYVRWTAADPLRPEATGEESDETAAVPELGRVAVVAAVDWAVRPTLHPAETGTVTEGSTAGDGSWRRRQVTGFLDRACASTSAEKYNLRCGTTDVRRGAPPAGTLGPSVLLDVARHDAGAFATTWAVPAECARVSGAERVLAALWGLAAERGHEAEVHHALFALRGGFEHSGPFAREAAPALVASLVKFGLEMADTDRRAQESRSRLRLV